MGEVPQVSSSLEWRDYWGTFKARWGVGRMHYTIEPGLYGLGTPHRESPVMVTANYKMSFDQLRAALPGRSAWILVLDTKGINVWCAAGKNTFGTEELAHRVKTSGLDQVLSHRKLILPQLSAPGVAAHAVKKMTGFEPVYGPIRAADLPAFLDAGLKATPEMRLKTFPFRERLVLVPIEFVAALKMAVFIIPLLLLAGGFGGAQGFWANVSTHGFLAALAVVSAILAGAVFTPLFLPWLPGRAFSVKGFSAGIATALVLAGWNWPESGSLSARLELFSWALLVPTISAYLGMNFTGASTYTSLSGVRKEMRWALPLQIVAGLLGVAVWLISRWIA